MSLSTVSVGRVSENLKALRIIETLRQNSVDLFKEENRLASGYQLLTPSENPVHASQVFNLNQLLERQDQVLTNLGHADGFLSATDQAITDINSILIDAQGIASEHAGNLTDAEQREAAIVTLDSLIDQLVMVGNRTYQGRYLFGGQRISEAPFVTDRGYVEFVGDTGNLMTHVDGEQTDTYNLTGDRLFGALSSEVKSWKDWNPAVTTDVHLADCDGTTGKGIKLGTVEIVETAVATFTVDLTSCENIGDVVDAINQAATDAGSSVTAAINGAGNGLQLTSGGPTIDVNDYAGGKAARDLGILTAGPVGMVVGSDIQPRVTELTKLGTLSGVNLANLAAGFELSNAGQSQVIATGTLNAASSVRDLINLIDAADLGVRAEINDDGTGLNIVNKVSGAVMSIGENGGSTAEELGIRSMHGGTLLSDLNNGKGLMGPEDPANSFGETNLRIVAKNGSSFEVDLNDASGGLDTNGDGLETLDDVIFAINTAAAGAGVAVTASLATSGNGIRLVDGTGGGGSLRVERMNQSYAVDDLGLAGKSVAGVELVGDDVHGITPDGVFTALYELRTALQAGDSRAITEAGGKIEGQITAVNNILGEVGSRARAMTQRRERTQEAVDATRKVLSEMRDLDYAEAVTRFQQAQLALQANLMSSSQSMSMSLLDFLG